MDTLKIVFPNGDGASADEIITRLMYDPHNAENKT